MNDTRTLLEKVKSGEISVDDALLALKKAPFEDLGFAKVDLHRHTRQGAGEVIYGAGKTADEITKIAESLLASGETRVLITRLSKEKNDALPASLGVSYDETARLGVIGALPEPDGLGRVVVATGGTSDRPVAEEAALTAAFYGSRVERLYDVGVAGLHRLLAHTDSIMSASVIIACAGMEGALASVIAGLADCPVVALPTSVGYGASFGGLAALLAMLNSCASGVSAVNIDNGFGAGYLAAMIDHMQTKERDRQ